jgi:hypothetical protein
MLLGKTAQDVFERMCEVNAQMRAAQAMHLSALEGLAARWGFGPICRCEGDPQQPSNINPECPQHGPLE